MELSNSMGSTGRGRGRQMQSGSTGAAAKKLPALAKRPNKPCSGIAKRPPPINVNVNVNVNVKCSQAGVAQSSQRKPNKANLKAAPLELLVVGRQLTMRPMFSRMPLPPNRTPMPGKSRSMYPLATGDGARARARAGAAAEVGLVAGAGLALSGAHILPAQQAAAVQLMEDSEFVYVFESYPLEDLWTAAQLDMPQESPPCKDKQLLPLLPVAQQVLDARFLAELCDELLMHVE